MKKSTIIAVILVLVVSTSGFAGMAIGANAGIGVSNFSGYDPSSYEPDDVSAALSYQIGVEFQFSLIPILGFKINGNYIRYAATAKNLSSEYDYDYRYFDISVAANLTVMKFSIYAGAFIAFNLCHTINDKDYKDYATSPVAGILIGAAYNMGLGPIKLPIGIEFKYILGGMVDEEKASPTHKAWALHFKVGILFGI